MSEQLSPALGVILNNIGEIYKKTKQVVKLVFF